MQGANASVREHASDRCATWIAGRVTGSRVTDAQLRGFVDELGEGAMVDEGGNADG